MKSSVCCASRGFLRDQPSDFSWGSGSGDDPLRFRVCARPVASATIPLSSAAYSTHQTSHTGTVFVGVEDHIAKARKIRRYEVYTTGLLEDS